MYLNSEKFKGFDFADFVLRWGVFRTQPLGNIRDHCILIFAQAPTAEGAVSSVPDRVSDLSKFISFLRSATRQLQCSTLPISIGASILWHPPLHPSF